MAGNYNLKQYTKAKVEAASPEETLLLLVREAVRSAEAARLDQDEASRLKLLDRSRRIIGELASTLNVDYGGEMAFNMLRLYMFINRRLVDALNGDDSGLPDALRILRHVRETWEEAVVLSRAQKASSPPQE
ncbi:MAG: flagellar export chaperone FliS [Myxococcota bacterium]|nr:flagellar export chaperone FliS [Myxococcota bacterium]